MKSYSKIWGANYGGGPSIIMTSMALNDDTSIDSLSFNTIWIKPT